MSELYDVLQARALAGRGSGGGFTPTQAQLDAMNSGITAEDVTQIGTNENNILLIEQYTVTNRLPYTLNELKMINTTGTWVNNVYTLNDITFTVNADMTIALTGINVGSGATIFILKNNSTNIKSIAAGNYKLTGCPEGGARDKYYLNIYKPNSAVEQVADYGTGANITLDWTNVSSPNFAIVVMSNTNTNGLVFKPMIRDSRIINSNYQPYTMTNAEITAWIQSHS